MDTNDDGVVSEKELADAMAILEKAKKDKKKIMQVEAFKNFSYQKI
jgi:hypothetical protein